MIRTKRHAFLIPVLFVLFHQGTAYSAVMIDLDIDESHIEGTDYIQALPDLVGLPVDGKPLEVVIRFTEMEHIRASSGPGKLTTPSIQITIDPKVPELFVGNIAKPDGFAYLDEFGSEFDLSGSETVGLDDRLSTNPRPPTTDFDDEVIYHGLRLAISMPALPGGTVVHAELAIKATEIAVEPWAQIPELSSVATWYVLIGTVLALGRFTWCRRVSLLPSN